MRLFRRVSDIVTANLHELVDEWENPEVMLSQAVREMEDALQTSLDHAAKVIASEKLLARQQASEDARIAACQQQAEAAVARQQDDVARTALRRKREHQRLATALADQQATAAAAGQRLRSQVEALRVRLAEARRQLLVLKARQSAATARRRLATDFGGLTAADDAISKFERFALRVDSAEAEAEAYVELCGGTICLDAEHDVELESELQGLKETSGRSGRD